MRRSLSTLALAVPAALGFFSLQSGSSQVKSHVDRLQSAPSMQVGLTVQTVGGSTEQHTLSLSKPNLLRWDSPARLLVTDGKTLWTYSKAAKTYTEEPFDGAVVKRLQEDAVWPLSAFFDPKFAEAIGSTKVGKARIFRGVAVTEVETTFAKRPTTSATLFFDTKLGVFRGGIWRSTVSESASDVIVMAEKLEVGKEPLPATEFAFTAPAGATKLATTPAPAAGVPYKDVQFIFEANCTGCHGTQMRRGGLSLVSYQTVMAGSRGGKVVIAGNSAGSPIMMHMKGQRRIMPPNGKMPDDVIAKVGAWIDAGANP